MVEQALELRARHGIPQHCRRAIGQDGREEARLLEPLEDLRHFREAIELPVEAHQAVAHLRVRDAQGLQRVVERIARDLPEVGMPSLQRAQPGVLQLLVAPQRGHRGSLVAEDIDAACRRGGEVEHRAVGVEDAGFHDQQVLRHRLAPGQARTPRYLSSQMWSKRQLL
jgi:hypothetical protein